MTAQKKFEELMKDTNAPGGLQNGIGRIVTSLFSVPTIEYKTVKDVSTMTDKVIFFYKESVIFEFSFPWCLGSAKSRKELTKQYKSLLNK